MNQMLPARPAASAASGSPTGYTARPRTLQERMQFLVADARRILGEPGQHAPDVVAWARDMVRAGIAEARK